MHLLNHARQITIQGLVQGVGFRPFVYRLAKKFRLKGWVSNTNEGVSVWVEGNEGHIVKFIDELRESPPIASSIYSIAHENCSPKSFSNFSIRESQTTSNHITQVSPDIAVCEDCLQDMKSQLHRLDYPFINCTHCGPRFTIIRNLPYDRESTTMEPFEMCDKCQDEYESISDRRFHAQPVACTHCGPVYMLNYRGVQISELEEILSQISELIEAGGIIAVKGLGGFHLMCDATNERAVNKLRLVKKRNGKPFAVMVKDVDTAAHYVEMSDAEQNLMSSWRRPIVLLKQKKPLAASINPGMSTIGLMLPHMPFHYLMFENFHTNAVVMTSGNLSDEPIVIDNREALKVFGDITDAVLTYNRDIHNRADDSVAFMANDEQRIIRRSKGYVPEPVRLSFNAEGILAVGAELSHCFALGKDKQVLLSQHIGDLKDPKTFAFFEESVSRFQRLFRMNPVNVVCDLHPDYLSTRYAKELHLPLLQVQHHHAHIAACMAEFHLDEPVIGVCWDGTGLGTDGHIWGGEFFYADLNSFERFSHLEYIPLPGSDKAALEPWRMGVSYLYKIMGRDFLKLKIPFIHEIRKKPELDLILQAIDGEINTPLTSAAGRLFDAVSAITNTCYHNSFHAEAPMKLESIIDESVTESYFCQDGKPISLEVMISEIVTDLQNEVAIPVISAKFHNTLISIIDTTVRKMKLKYKTNKVVLTGGVFQNRYLLEKTINRLNKEFEVYSPQNIPANDAGIALGQLAIAAKKLNKTISP